MLMRLIKKLFHKEPPVPTLLQDLKNLQARGPLNDDLGICGNLHQQNKGAFLQLSLNWPEHSGSLLHPVPMPICETTRYIYHQRTDASLATTAYIMLPLWTGPYGNLRWRLVSWCIAQLEDKQ